MKKQIKRSFASLLVVIMMITSVPVQGLIGLELPELDFGWLKNINLPEFNGFDVKAEADFGGKSDDGLTWEYSNGTLTISGSGNMYNYLYEYNRPWKAYEDDITKVIIGNSVTSIGENAFFSCDSLINVTIPDSVASIGSYAFSYCDSLTSVIIPNSVTSIGVKAFYSCDNLKSITIGNSVTKIGSYAFDYCKNITNVFYAGTSQEWNEISIVSNNGYLTGANIVFEYNKNNVETIDGITYHITDKGVLDVIYLDKEVVTTVVIPNEINSITVKNVYSNAFNNCDSLTNITIPDSVTSVSSYAFNSCDSLTSVTIPNNVTSIGYSAFNSCDALTSVTIGNSVTSVGDRAFNSCDALTSVTIGNSVTSVGDWAFYSCDNITNVFYSGTSQDWYDINFGYENDNLTSVNIIFEYNKNNVKTIDGITYHITDRGILDVISLDEDITSAVIPNEINSITVKSIYSHAFNNCDGLTNITIPDSVTSVGSYAFNSCDSLINIFYSESSQDWNNISFSYGNDDFKNTNIIFEYNKNNVETIDAITYHITDKGVLDVIALDKEVTTLVIPNKINSITVKSIYFAAFENCDSITSVTISDNVTSIGSCAFEDCDNLKIVTISNSVMSIGYSAFKDCDRLKSISIGASVTSIGSYAFEDCKWLNNIFYSGTFQDWNDISFGSYNDDLTSANIIFEYNKNNVETIDGATYYVDNSGALYLVTLDDEVTSITIPFKINSITVRNIGYCAFKNCDRLTSVTIGDNVTDIGIYAFYDCDRLTNITIGDNVTNIGKSAFYYCNSLKSIIIGCSVKNIGPHTFYYCNNLKNVIIPDSVKWIGENAFNYCDSLNNVFYSGTSQEWNNIYFGYSNNDLKSANIICEINKNNIATITGATYCVDNTGSLYLLDLDKEATSIIIPYKIKSIIIRRIARKGLEGFTFESITIPKSITEIFGFAFDKCDNLKNVIYDGSEDELEQIKISAGNGNLLNASFTYKNLPKIENEFNTDFKAQVNKLTTDENFTKVATLTEGDGEITYTSADTNVATVNTQTGEVTIVGAGSTEIIAYASETIMSTSAQISYTIVVEKTQSEFNTDFEAQVNKLTTDENFTKTATLTSGDGEITYTSADTNVATVNLKTGEVTIIGVGSTEITATVSETNMYTAAQISYKIVVKTQSEFNTDFKAQVNKFTTDENFTKAATLTVGDGEITYTSADTNVATVNAQTGKVTIIGAGSTEITATVSETDTYTTEQITYKIVVVKTVSVFAEDFTGKVTVRLGETVPTRTASLLFGEGEISYSSSNTDVATVNSQTGEVTIVGTGSAMIVASVRESDMCTAEETLYKLVVKHEESECAISFYEKFKQMMQNFINQLLELVKQEISKVE